MKKTVLVTGGARGIGAQTAKVFAEHGFQTVISYISSEQKALKVALDIGAKAICADSADPAAVKNMVDEIISQYGQIDVLVNNAGISLIGLFQDISYEQRRRLYDVNLFGTLNCIHEVLPYMIRRKYGRIINVASMWGQTGASCEADYSASKAAVIGLTKALAKETAPSGINVNCVSPGFIMTDMNRCFSDSEIEQIVEDIPVGRYGTPDDVAQLIYSLALDTASFITGQIIGVNGGEVI
ncbi:MAG: 3-oxoacyl-ACP reductase FabG [Oscillospiraceae bacterium]|nr:3-oxoacyl-ACP reductase FabG [Oscillospiraceae bacterium]